MATTDELLDLVPSQRSGYFRYKVLGLDLAQIGELNPDQDTPPTVEFVGTRVIQRDMRGLAVSAAQERDIDSIGDRIAPEFVLENGAVLPLGVFLYVDASRLRRFYAGLVDPSFDFAGALLDQCFILDQKLSHSVGYMPGTPIYDILDSHFAESGVPYWLIDGITTVIGEGGANWPAGTSRLEVMNSVAAMAGCLPVFFDNSGLGRVQIREDLATATPVVRYKYGEDADGRATGNIYSNTSLESDALLNAPNQWVVIESSATAVPIIGIADLPDASPQSALHRGFVIPDVIDAQGLQDQAAADAMAAAIAEKASADFRWVTFEGPPDPRHDCYSAVEFDGVMFREAGWRMTLQEGAPMSHDIKNGGDT